MRPVGGRLNEGLRWLEIDDAAGISNVLIGGVLCCHP